MPNPVNTNPSNISSNLAPQAREYFKPLNFIARWFCFYSRTKEDISPILSKSHVPNPALNKAPPTQTTFIAPRKIKLNELENKWSIGIQSARNKFNPFPIKVDPPLSITISKETYTITQQLGAGTYSKVWEVTDTSGKKYALKQANIYHSQPETSSWSWESKNHEKSLQDYLDDTCKRLNIECPTLQIKNLIGLDKNGNETKTKSEIRQSLILMETVKSKTLDKSMISLNQNNKIEVLKKLCEAVIKLHACGVIHKDLKPENILVVYNEDKSEIIDVKLIDLDFSSKVNEPKAALPCGTERYIPPEQEKSKPFKDTETTELERGNPSNKLLKKLYAGDDYALGKIFKDVLELEIAEDEINKLEILKGLQKNDPQKRKTVLDLLKSLETINLEPSPK